MEGNIPFKDPCKGCLIQPICEKMCPDVIEFYKKIVRIRTKKEIEETTGYIYEEDNECSMPGFILSTSELKKEVKPNLFKRILRRFKND